MLYLHHPPHALHAATFFVVSVIIFLMMHSIPGGPFDGDEMPLPDNIKARLMAELGLDKPLWEQYLRYMWGVLHLDFGVPYQSPGETVMGLIAHRLECRASSSAASARADRRAARHPARHGGGA